MPDGAGTPARWNRVVLWHGALALAFVVGLRLEKAAVLSIEPRGLAGWARFLAPDLACVLVVACCWLVLGPGRGRRWAMAGAYLVLLTLTAVAHSFLLITGHRLELALMAYAARNFGILREIFALVADERVVLRLVAAVTCALLPLVLPRHAGLRLPRWATVAGLILALLASALFPVRRAPAMAENDVVAFFASGRRLFDERRAARHAVAAEDFYRAPILRPPATRTPNLILVILESTGFGAVMGEPGSPAAAPALARLAAEGVLVERAYASVTHTSKALIGILCGVLPRLEMDIVESLEGNLPIPCLPRLLQDLGYRTVFLQSAWSGFENRPGLVRNLGFAEGAYRETLERPGFERLGYFGLDDAAMLEPALSWIASAGEGPYFMTLLTSAPHHPYQTPGTSVAQATADPRAAYRRAIAEQDRFLEELVRRLESARALEGALLVVLGDHGEAFGEHQRQQHDAVPYEEVVRVPWVFYGPDILGPPRTIAGLRHHIDLLPTVLSLLGVEWEGSLPGRDLLRGEGHELVVSACWWSRTCLTGRLEGIKVVYHFGRRPLEVFDLARDPLERDDLQGSLDAAVVREIEDRLLGYKLTVDRFWAQFPVRNGPPGWWAEGVPRPGAGNGLAATPPERSR